MKRSLSRVARWLCLLAIIGYTVWSAPSWTLYQWRLLGLLLVLIGCSLRLGVMWATSRTFSRTDVEQSFHRGFAAGWRAGRHD